MAVPQRGLRRSRSALLAAARVGLRIALLVVLVVLFVGFILPASFELAGAPYR